MSPEPVTWHGLPALLLTNTRLRIVILPELGGKIASIFDLLRGYEWLATNPWLVWQRPTPGASYIRQFDLGGWDECFPNIAPGPYPTAPWEGQPLPDHGELWSQPWRATLEAERLVMRAEGSTLPYRFERAITLAGNSIFFDYQVENHADDPLHYLWSSHPLLNIQAGMQLGLPEGTPVRLWGHSPLGPSGWKLSWPNASFNKQPITLSEIPSPQAGWAAKLFAGPLIKGWAVVHNPLGNGGLRFEFNPKTIPYVGLWCNFGGWSGSGSPPLYNLGLEPCRGAPDDLATAVNEWNSASTLAPRATDRWSLRLTVL